MRPTRHHALTAGASGPGVFLVVAAALHSTAGAVAPSAPVVFPPALERPASVPIACQASICSGTFEGVVSATEPEPLDPLQRPRWQATLNVQAGDVVCIVAEGTVFDGDDADVCGGTAGPDGTGCAVGGLADDWNGNLSHLGLIGRIRLESDPESFLELDDGVDDSGVGLYGPGFVGAVTHALVVQSGTLELSINDASATDNSGSYTVSVCASPRCAVHPNDPDPFCASATVAGVTELQFTLALRTTTQVEVYPPEATSPVRHLMDGMLEAGKYSVLWDGRDDDGALVPEGEYVFVLTAEDCAGKEPVNLTCTPTPAPPRSWGVIKRTFGEP